MRQKKFLLAVAILSLGLLGGCNWLRARDSLNKGVQAYGASNYPVAVEFFAAALEADPEVPNAELYLGLSYAGQFIPNFSTPENNEFARLAIESYESVLAKDPNSTTAIRRSCRHLSKSTRTRQSPGILPALVSGESRGPHGSLQRGEHQLAHAEPQQSGTDNG